MKNIWKKIFVGALLTTAVAGFSGCKKGGDNNVSVDLDGDGIISEWEEVFESKGVSDRLVYKTIKNIETLSDLKAINGKDKDTAYVLTKNIDCDGETLSINVGASNYIYGNNKIIRNFKLGKVEFGNEEDTVDNGLKEYLSNSQTTSMCLFYNAGAIYDLRLFMGKQTFDVSDAEKDTFEASPFNSVQYVDNVVVKGAIKVKSLAYNKEKTYNLSLCDVDHSGLSVEISNVEVQGLVDYTEETKSAIKLNMAGVIPTVSRLTSVYGINAKANLSAYTISALLSIGQVASDNYGFVSTAQGNGNIDVLYTEQSSLYCGGIVGYNGGLAEVRNSTMNGSITFTSNVDFAITQLMETSASVGGIVGVTESGIISYCTSDAQINGTNLTKLKIGAICGSADRAMISNTISRGSINLTNINGLTVANVVGRMSYGTVEKAIALSEIVVDNHMFNMDKIRMGMVTVFEGETTSTYTRQSSVEGEESEEVVYYDMLSEEQKTPEFGYILVGGKNEVYTKTNDSDTFECNLGLRDKFLYMPVGGDELESYTYSMQMFRDLYYLETYSVVQYYDNEGVKTRINNLDVSYPSAGGTSKINIGQVSTVCQPTWFKTYLCFNYGANHNEVDLSGVSNSSPNATQTLNTINFTLSEDLAKTRYYESEQYNGSLSRFDKKFDTVSSVTDTDYDMYKDELFSYLNYLLQLDMSYIRPPVDGLYTSLVFNIKFFEGSVYNEGADGESVTETVYASANFARRIEDALKQMGCTASTTYLAKDGTECEANSDSLFKLHIDSASVSGGVSTKYAFDFDVRNFVNDSLITDPNGEYCYVINLMYVKY